MSRALDKDAVASIEAGDSQKAYDDIVKVFSPITNSYSFTHELLEFELLGKSHPALPGINIFLLENSVGIPKIKLVQAFVVARQVFFKFKDLGPDYSQEIRDATSVILLTDPEHLTACNARKRLIQNIRTSSVHELETALKRELYFIDCLLTSHLNRHTKSPTLWSHRRWLLEVRQSMYLPHDVPGDLASIVMVAAERHPRNYYAWSHMRWLVESVEGGIDASTYLVMIDDVKKWCLKHPGDTSGWSFLLFCLSSDTFLETSSPVVRSSLDSGGNWERDREVDNRLLQTLENPKNSLDDSKGRKITQAAREWYLEYGLESQSTG